jgi:hypothetical protein
MPVGSIQKSPPFFPTYKKEQRAAPERSVEGMTRDRTRQAKHVAHRGHTLFVYPAMP